MRLLFVTQSFPPPDRPLANVGGMQRVAMELHHALVVRQDVIVSTLALETSWRMTSVKTGPFLVRLLWDIPRRVRREGIDVVLFSSMVTGALAPLLQWCQGGRGRSRAGEGGRAARLAAIVHGRDVTFPAAPWQRYLPRIFAALDVVLPVSGATGRACEARGLPADKARVVRNGVDPGRFRPLADRATMRQELLARFPGAAARLPADGFLLFSVGRHVERKGFAWFAQRVMPRLPENVVFWLAGEGPETARIRDAVRSAGLGDRVRLLGRVNDDELEVLYRGADLFVMPNLAVRGDFEGFGVVMLEAGMCGLPVVAAAVDGIPEVVCDGVNGRLVAPGDAEAFAAVIGQLQAAQADRADAGQRARAYVAEQFAWQVVVQQYLRSLQTSFGDAVAR